MGRDGTQPWCLSLGKVSFKNQNVAFGERQWNVLSMRLAIFFKITHGLPYLYFHIDVTARKAPSSEIDSLRNTVHAPWASDRGPWA